MVQRAPVVAGRSVRVQVVRGAEDRVVRVVDVAAHAVRRPGRRDELHRPLRAGGAVVPHPAEGALDEVHRGQDLPADAEAALRLAVVPEQDAGGLRRAGAEAAPRLRRGERRELTPGTDRGASVGGDPARQAGEHGARRARPAAQEAVDALLVEGVERRRPRAARRATGRPARATRRPPGQPALGRGSRAASAAGSRGIEASGAGATTVTSTASRAAANTRQTVGKPS